jgi:hypothetical protein
MLVHRAMDSLCHRRSLHAQHGQHTIDLPVFFFSSLQQVAKEFASVSQRHLQVEYFPDKGFSISDLGSTLGTWVGLPHGDSVEAILLPVRSFFEAELYVNVMQ